MSLSIDQIRKDVESMKRQGLIRQSLDKEAFKAEVERMKAQGLLIAPPQGPPKPPPKTKFAWAQDNPQRAINIHLSDDEFEAVLAKGLASKDKSARRWRAWRIEDRKRIETRPCACGCGTIIHCYTKNLVPAKYARNHYKRAPSTEQSKLKQKVLSVFKGTTSIHNIAKVTGIRKERVSDIVWRLKEDGIVRKIDYGIYKLVKESA